MMGYTVLSETTGMTSYRFLLNIFAEKYKGTKIALLLVAYNGLGIVGLYSNQR